MVKQRELSTPRLARNHSLRPPRCKVIFGRGCSGGMRQRRRRSSGSKHNDIINNININVDININSRAGSVPQGAPCKHTRGSHADGGGGSVAAPVGVRTPLSRTPLLMLLSCPDPADDVVCVFTVDVIVVVLVLLLLVRRTRIINHLHHLR
jgi:hypothetical protein